MDAVFALQRAGSDAVFAFQFPVAAAVQQGAGAGLGAWPYQRAPETTRRRTIREQIEADEAERAEEIATAAVARAASVPAEIQAPQRPQEAPASLADVMRAWMAPVAVLNVSMTAIEAPRLVAEPIQQPPSAALDEDAILAATALFMRRRRKA